MLAQPAQPGKRDFPQAARVRGRREAAANASSATGLIEVKSEPLAEANRVGIVTPRLQASTKNPLFGMARALKSLMRGSDAPCLLGLSYVVSAALFRQRSALNPQSQRINRLRRERGDDRMALLAIIKERVAGDPRQMPPLGARLAHNAKHARFFRPAGWADRPGR